MWGENKMNEQQGSVKKVVDRVFSAEENSAAALGSEKLSRHNRLAIKMFHTSVLTNKEKFAPGVGQFAEKLVLSIETYRTLYFVNVLKIDMVYVTLILTLIGIYDVLNNPLLGIAYDRTRSRWGKARPYILLGVIPYYLSNAVLYSGASFLGERAGNDPVKIIFVFCLLFIQETFSTIYKIPRENLLTLMSPYPNDRINVGLIQIYMGDLGARIVYAIFLPLMEMSNKGILPFSLSGVFASLAAFGSVFGIAANVYMGMKCKERIILQQKPANSVKALFYVLKNKYSLRNFAAEFSVGWWSNGGYSWDVVTQQEIFGGVIPTTIAMIPYTLFDYLSVTFIPKFQKIFKSNNRNALLALRFWDIIAAAAMLSLGLPFIENRWAIVAIYAVFHGLEGFNNGPANVFEAEIKREIDDYTEYVTGERPDGSIGILTGLIQKLTAPINAVFTVFLFKWSGYDSTITMLPWSQGNADVYRKVFFLFVGITIFPNIIKAIPYFFYDIVGEKREKMYVSLNERRAYLASQNDNNEELENIMEAVAEMDEKN